MPCTGISAYLIEDIYLQHGIGTMAREVPYRLYLHCIRDPSDR